jgi:hypothetical protein
MLLCPGKMLYIYPNSPISIMFFYYDPKQGHAVQKQILTCYVGQLSAIKVLKKLSLGLQGPSNKSRYRLSLDQRSYNGSSGAPSYTQNIGVKYIHAGHTVSYYQCKRATIISLVTITLKGTPQNTLMVFYHQLVYAL